MGAAVSEVVSHGIANQLNNKHFLNHMGVSNMEELQIHNPNFQGWLLSIQEMLRIRWLEQEKEQGQGQRQPKIEQAGPFHDPNAIYAISVTITVQDKIIHQIGEKDLWDMENMENQGINLLQKPIVSAYRFLDTEGSSPIIQGEEQVGSVTARVSPTILLFLFLAFVFAVVMLSISALIISKVITYFFVYPIVRPLTLLQKKMEAIANEQLEDAIHSSLSMDKKPLREIASLTDSTNRIITKMKEYIDLVDQQKGELEAQKQELESQRDELESQNEELEAVTEDLKETSQYVEQKNKQLENFFNNVGQGFLSFGVDLLIDEEYSAECKNIFGVDIKHEKLSQLLFPEDEEQILFLDSIFQKILYKKDPNKSEIYLSLLPTEVTLHNRFIQIEYKQIGYTRENSGMFMVILTDITDKRALEYKMEEEKNILKMVVKVVVNYNDFMDCVEEYKEFYRFKLQELLESQNPLQEIYHEVYRNIHNFKGNFSQFDLCSVIQQLHTMETQISKSKKNLPNMDVWEFGGFIRQFNLALWLEEDLDILRTFLGDEFFFRKNAFAVDKQKLLEIERKMINTLSPKECSLLLPDIKRLRYQPFKELMKTYPEYVAKLAERMDKTIEPVVIEDDEAVIDTEYYHDFAKSLVHIFRNSVDHGIETIEERVIAGKSEAGNIGCKITKQKEMLQIIIADDGRGIDLEAIRHKAVERGMFSQEEAQNVSSEDLLHVIFRDEFSTKEEVTEISGRGVGLASVKAELGRVGGTVEIQTHEGRGTEFIFTLPLEQKNESVQVSISHIMDALIDTSKHFMQEQNMGTFELDEDISQTNRICLNNITALINIRGIVDAILVLSLNEQLAHRLVKSFVIEELTPEEEQGYIEDVVAEAFNIIAGNSIKQLKEIEDFITIGTPTIICYKGASIKYADSQIWSCVLGVEESEYSISLISMDKNLSEEGNIWHVF